jgi:hypothetical protein
VIANNSGAWLQDFSLHNIPKRVKIYQVYQMAIYYTKWQ